MSSRVISIVAVVVATVMILWLASQKASSADAVGGRLGLPLGKPCTIYLRGDAIGGAPNNIPAKGAWASESGRLVEVNDNWLVLEAGNRQAWVPRSSILLLEVAR